MYFFVKDDLPEDETSEDTVKLIQHLAKVGLDIDEYTTAFNATNKQRLELWHYVILSNTCTSNCFEW